MCNFNYLKKLHKLVLEVLTVFSVKPQLLTHKNKWESSSILMATLLIWYKLKGQQGYVTGKIMKVIYKQLRIST